MGKIRRLLDKFGFNWLFFWIVLIIYIFCSILNLSWWIKVGEYFITTFVKNILPILILVYILMFVFSVIIDRKVVQHFFEKGSYFTKLFFSIIGWIFSSWPVYLWYPFLANLKEKGLTSWHIAAFVYARAIKIPLLVMMVSFFGLKYTVIFNLVLFVIAFLVGLIMDYCNS